MRDWLNDWQREWLRLMDDKDASVDVGNRLGYESVQRIHKEKEKQKKKKGTLND